MMHTSDGTMANQQGNGRGGSPPDEERSSWRAQDSDRYRMRDDDERFERGYGSHWEDRERSQGSWASGSDRGTDDRWAGRGGSPWGSERFGQRDYARGGWSQQGYGYNDSDRPGVERGVAGTRPQHRYAAQGYGETGQGAYRQHPAGGAQGLEMRRGSHRGKGPQGFQRSDERVRELVCEALTDDDDVDATQIEVSVKNAEVILTGSVEDREMKRRAEDCVERVPGVRDVHNQLRITRA